MSAPATSIGRKAGVATTGVTIPAFDLDGDGIADTAYRPNDLIDQVLWTQPAARC